MDEPDEPRAVEATSTPRRERLLLVGACYLIGLWCIVPAFGRIAPETKLALSWDPTRFLARSLGAWDPSASFGRLQNQAVGYLFPMGAFSAATRALGVPVWMVPRLAMAILISLSLLGAHRLARLLGVSTTSGRFLAGAIYALAPAALTVAPHQAGTHLPWALAPWVLVPLLQVDRLGPRRAAARSALVVAAMGGINAASTAAVLVPALVFFATRTPGAARRRFVGWWLGGVIAAVAWWALPLVVSVRHGFDFTAHTEQTWLTASTQTAGDVWRGTGNWLAYIDHGGRPIQPGARGMVQDTWAIAGSMALVTAGALGLARRDAPGRRWLIPTAVLGAIVMGGAFRGQLTPSPTTHWFRALLDGPLVAFRNMSKFSALVQLPLAIGAGHLLSSITASREQETVTDDGADRPEGVEEPATDDDSSPPTVAEASTKRPALAAWAPVFAAIAVLGSISPTIGGGLLLPGSFETFPDAWQEVAEAPSGAEGTRTLILPAAVSAEYLWGRPIDEPYGILGDQPWAVRDLIPLGGNGSTRLLDGIEDAIAAGRLPDGFAEALRRAGVARIVVRNDLDSFGDGGPSPATMRHLLATADGIEPGPSYGPELDLALVVDDGAAGRGVPVEPVRQIDTWIIDDPVAGLAAHDATDVLRVGGGPEALLHLPPALTEGRAVLLADDAADLTDVVDGVEMMSITTDTARRRDVRFGEIRRNRTWTLTASESSPSTGDEPLDRWQAAAPPMTIAELVGARSITETLDRTNIGDPGTQPFAAFDGNPQTFWPGDEAGDQLTVTFDAPTTLSDLRITVPTTEGRRVTAVAVTTDVGELLVRFGDDGQAVVPIAGTMTRELGVEIVEVGEGQPAGPIGIADIDLGEVELRRPLLTAAIDRDGTPADGAVLDRARVAAGHPSGSDEDGLLDRRMALTTGLKAASGTATVIDAAALGLPLPAGDDGGSGSGTGDASDEIVLGCGAGPALRVDGREVPTSISTSAAGLAAGEPVRWEACGPIEVTEDITDLTAPWGPNFVIDTAVILPFDPASGIEGTSTGPDPDAASPESDGAEDPGKRAVTIDGWGDQGRDATIGPGGPTILAGTENRNDGWSANFDGNTATAITVDGWRQAWLIPAADDTADLELTFGANRSFRAGLIVGLVALLGLVVVALIPRRDDEAVLWPGERKVHDLVATLLALAVGICLGWLSALALLPILVIRRRRPDLMARLLGLSLLVLALWLLAPIGDRWADTNGGFRPGAQFTAVIAWMLFALTAAEGPVTGAGDDDEPGSDPRPRPPRPQRARSITVRMQPADRTTSTDGDEEPAST